MFADSYRGRRVWLSGHTGFKGAWLAAWLRSLGAEVRGYALAPDETQPLYAALGLGVLNKFLEGWTGAVLAKIAVLVFIIVFIQKRPQGLFAMKGRSAEA